MMGLDRATLWTIVPVRGLAAGKSRLAPVLNRAGRAALNRELLERTLAVIRVWSGAPQRTLVVSSCARTLALARKAGAAAVSEGRRAIGLNRAVRLGIARAVSQGATHVLVLPCDLPYLSTGTLRALVRAAGSGKRVVLAPDKVETGTNAVLVRVGTGFEFAFGPGSLRAHHAAAVGAELTVSLVQRDDLQLDLDTPEDFTRWKQQARCASRKAA